MDVFKLKPYIHQSIAISDENFALYTNKKPPYYQMIRGKQKYFAVCPVCNNPITIIGLYKNEEGESRKPFGKHYPASIRNLAEYDEEEYYNCPYHNAGYIGVRKRRPADSKTGNSIYRYLMDNYDEIIRYLEKRLEIHISYSFGEKLKNSFIENKGWEYYDCTYQNLPFMLLYAEPAFTLVKRKIEKNGDVYNAIEKTCNSVRFENDDGQYVQIVPKENQWVDLSAYVAVHKRKVEDERLTESFRLVITYNDQKILSKRIVV